MPFFLPVNYTGAGDVPKFRLSTVGYPGAGSFSYLCKNMDVIYEPTMSKRDFMLASLKANAKLQPRDVESFWKKKKAVESVDKDVRRKPPSKYYDELTKEQLDALFDGYYTQLRGSVGARGFWEWFNRNNDQQKESIENKGKPSGKTREVTYKDGSTGVYEYKVQPFVSWR